MFFDGKLAGCEVKWSNRMTLWYCMPASASMPNNASAFCPHNLIDQIVLSVTHAVPGCAAISHAAAFVPSD